MGNFAATFFKTVGYLLVIIAVFWVWLDILVMSANQCGAGKISIGITNHGVYCFQAEKWTAPR